MQSIRQAVKSRGRSKSRNRSRSRGRSESHHRSENSNHEVSVSIPTSIIVPHDDSSQAEETKIVREFRSGNSRSMVGGIKNGVTKPKLQVEKLRQNLIHVTVKSIERRQQEVVNDASTPPATKTPQPSPSPTSTRKRMKSKTKKGKVIGSRNKVSDSIETRERNCKKVSDLSPKSARSWTTETTKAISISDRSLTSGNGNSKRSSNSVRSTRSFTSQHSSKAAEHTNFASEPSSDLRKNETEKRQQLRAMLMEESMRVIERRQNQARKLSMASNCSSQSGQSNSEFDYFMKQSIKQHSTRSSYTRDDLSHNSWHSKIEIDRDSSKRGDSERRKRTIPISPMVTEKPKIEVVDDTSTRSKSPWRTVVQTMIRSRSKSRSRSERRSRSRSRSKSKTREIIENSIRSASRGRSRSKSRSRSTHCSERNGVARMRSLSRSSSKGRIFPNSQNALHSPDMSIASRKAVTEEKELKQCQRNSGFETNCIFTTLSQNDDDDNLLWHNAIIRHDWEHVKLLLHSYDHTKYREQSKAVIAKDSILPAHEKLEIFPSKEKPDTSPLLRVDQKGRTPLHWGCIEHMPSNLLRRLVFAERAAAFIQDNDGRYPLHLVAMSSLDQTILDRMIRANPESLCAPDNLQHTPLRYAILKADRSRPRHKKITWNHPVTKDAASDQNQQRRAYENVSFILETMTSRRKFLSPVHEKRTLIESCELFAPPKVINVMVFLSEKILENDRVMAEELVNCVFRLKHPLNIIHRVLETASKVIPAATLLAIIRKNLTDHYNEGCIDTVFEGPKGDTTCTYLAKEVAIACQSGSQLDQGTGPPACQEWWDKLRYLIVQSGTREKRIKSDTLLHIVLTNPKSQPSLIEFICRLNPAARYKLDVGTGALPIHIACMYWHPEKHGVGNEASRKRVLNLLLAGDFDLVRTTCQGRIALHYAILNGKSMAYIHSLLNLDRGTISTPDPVTRLFPFQLAAASTNYISESVTKDIPSRSLRAESRASTQQVDVIYQLLRKTPSLISVNQEPSLNPLTRHVLKLCYDFSPTSTGVKWKLNLRRKRWMRHAIEKAYIPNSMRKWYMVLEELIWASYDSMEHKWEPMLFPPRSKEAFLIATMWNIPYLPPIAVELILELYSKQFERVSRTALPIHIASRVSPYQSQPFEKTLSMGSALEMITLLQSSSLETKNNEGRLPLHLAIDSGKGWKHLRGMIALAPKTLTARDPSTRLLPFQQVAIGSSIASRSREISAKMARATKSKTFSTEKNSQILRLIRKKYELEKLTTIYGILRCKPSVINMR